ncbi:MAG TPA: spermidine/putrescine ABC transporter substrate-binding protein [Humisphaera sp.]
MKRFPLALGVLVSAMCLAALAVGGCKKETAGPAGQPGGTPAAEEKVVNLYIFANYVPKDVLDDFTLQTGIKVNHVNFSSNEELLAKLQSGTTEYDVVSPSDYMVRRLAAMSLVRKLDRAKLTNFGNLDPAFLGRGFDRGNDYSVPFFWGTTGIGFNKKKVTGPVDSWSVLFDPKYADRALMLNDSRELLAAALRRAGKSANDRDVATINAAIAELRKQHDAVKPKYDSDTFADKLAAGDVWVAQGLNGEIGKVVAAKPDELGWVVPKEGATLWMDNLCVPARSKRPGNAHLLIDYLMRPDVAAKVANAARYGSPNKAAMASIDKAQLGDPIIYPPADVLKRCESMEDLGAEANKLVDGLMNEIK